MLRRVCIPFLTLLAIIFLICERVHAETVSLGHFRPADALINQFLVQLSDNVFTDSRGELRINILPRATFSSEEDLLNRIQNGNIQLGLISSDTLSSAVVEFRLFDLPYLFKTYDQVDEILDGKFGHSLLSTLHKAGLVGLSIFDEGFIDLLGRRPITSPDELKGLKVLVGGGDIRQESILALGGKPETIPRAEVFFALETGVIDAIEASPRFAHMVKESGKDTYFSLTRNYYRAAILVANSKWYSRSINYQSRKILMEQAVMISRKYRESRREQEIEMLQGISKYGIIVVRDVNVSLFEDRVRSLYEKEPIASIVNMLKQLDCPEGCPLPPICCSK